MKEETYEALNDGGGLLGRVKEVLGYRGELHHRSVIVSEQTSVHRSSSFSSRLPREQRTRFLGLSVSQAL